jgi:hypothetical protein
MGSVGGLLGLGGGAGGTGFSTQPGTNPAELQAAYQGNQAAMANQNALLSALTGQGGIQKQGDVYNQLQGVVSGQGPNPAQAMLNQATGANVANQAALMAGQRGASSNTGLMARQTAQQGGALQQQAAGQGASMQAQQGLGALGQAGALATGMAGNQIGQTNANVAAQQNEQSILQGANTANNQIQGQLANTTLRGQQDILGGLMGSGSGAAKMAMGAHGGQVQNYADGGSAFTPQSMFAQSLAGQNQPQITPFNESGEGSKALQKGMGQLGSSIGTGVSNYMNNPMRGTTNAVSGGDSYAGTDTSLKDPSQMFGAGGGKVPAMVSPGERFLRPEEAQAVADGNVDPMEVGEEIPGQAKAKGDSYKNDFVPKKLDVGGIVLPRSITKGKNPGAEAKKFVDAYMSKKRRKA